MAKRQTIDEIRELEAAAANASGSADLNLAESISEGMASAFNPTLPFGLAPNGVLGNDTEKDLAQGIQSVLDAVALDNISNTIFDFIGSMSEMLDDWLKMAMKWVERMFNKTFVEKREGFGNYVKTNTLFAHSAPELDPIETAFDAGIEGVSGVTFEQTVTTARNAIKTAMDDQMLGAAIFSEDQAANEQAMQKAHAAASVAIRTLLDKNKDGTVPSAEFEAQVTILSDRLATALTGVSSPTLDGVYGATTSYRGAAKAFVDNTNIAGSPFDTGTNSFVAQAADAIGTYNTTMQSAISSNAARASAVNTEVDALDQTTTLQALIANNADRTAIISKLKSLRSDTAGARLIDDAEFTILEEAINDPANHTGNIKQMLEALAKIDVSLLEDIVITGNGSQANVTIDFDNSATPTVPHIIETDATEKKYQVGFSY